jgi:hypothetical protein
MEGLHFALDDLSSIGLFYGVNLPSLSAPLSHLFFADDVIIFGDWALSNVQNLSRVLNCFHLASGLKINLNKSRIFGIGVDFHCVSSFAASIGCKSDKLSFTYLGLPIGTNMACYKGWKPITDV